VSPLPSYDELPLRPGLPPGSSWGVWGEDDRRGCLNLLTPGRVVAAAAEVRTGRAFPLNLEAELPDPPLFGRSRLRHVVTGAPGSASHDDVLHDWNTQSSSQWDGFRHIRHPRHGHYGGVDDEDHGIDHWGAIAGRAVLADVARWREAEGRPLALARPDPIGPDDVAACLAHQGTTVEVGDILLVRTGWVGWYRGLDAGGRRRVAADLACPGLRPGTATARYLWDLHVAAVAADNPALEVWPPGARAGWREALRDDPSGAPEVFLHTALLPLLGLPIGELFDLDGLAEACAADGRYESFFTSAPLRLAAGVASPPNALAIR
jgi:kynurenine formamidase